MEKVKGFYQTTIQPTIVVVKQKLEGVASAAQNNALPILQKSYAVCIAGHFCGELMHLFMLGTACSVERICPHR